ncbi:MAG: transglutaminase domain-containing protein [Planctomycetota bacterium]|nr:transglutaminase domain-containing protein [Planctomycetota bacterium]
MLWITCTLCLVLSNPFVAADPEPGKQVPRTVTLEISDEEGNRTVEMNYQLFVPTSFDADKKMPLLLFLHGAGERGDNIEKVKKWGPPRFVDKRPDFPFIVVSPQCPRGQYWDTPALSKLLDHLEQTLPVDSDQILITGLSMGGFGTWSLIAAEPDRFAAAAPVCGGGHRATAPRLTEIPIWNFHGADDSVVQEKRSKQMVEAIRAAGGTRIKYTLYPDVGHDSWKQAYSGKELWNWLLEQNLRDRNEGQKSRQISIAPEILEKAQSNRSEIEKAMTSCSAAELEQMKWLLERMPDSDLQDLTAEYLLENLREARGAMETAPWRQQIPEEIFRDAILPYASINERRDRWRPDFRQRFSSLVAEADSPSQAAAILNQKIYGMLEVKYSTKRPKADQSPYESMEAGLASCTGLSVLLIDACRSVGVPARFVGTPLWSDGSGNHSWVEIWDDGWHFTGAAEPTGDQLDRAWFTGRASGASRETPDSAIYAVTWQNSPISFPMVWKPQDQSIRAVDVTDRYTSKEPIVADGQARVRFVVVDPETGERLSAAIQVFDQDSELLFEGIAKDERFDGNDHLSALLEKDKKIVVIARHKDSVFCSSVVVEKDEQLIALELASLTEKEASTATVRFLGEFLAVCGLSDSIQNTLLADVPLTQEDADEAARQIWQAHAAQILEQRADEMEQQVLTIGDLKMPFWFEVAGTPQQTGRRLWISLHGGGGAPAEVNDQQWENQKKLYRPEEGVYLVPRAPTNTWNMWHQGHIDQFFDRLIGNLIVFHQVDPNHVYVMGYSAGGDGVYQIGPRMADRWAAAAMMAGHPNDARPDSLRNTAFTIHMGAKDEPYNRNGQAEIWQNKLKELSTADPEGYPHWVEIYPDKGHWMDREDVAAVPWMADKTRNLRPERIVWQQDDVTHRRFYWLALDEPRSRGRIEVSREGQKIRILHCKDVDAVTIRLDDSMIDLDRSVQFEVNGDLVHSAIIPRTIATIAQTMSERGDPIGMFSAQQKIVIPELNNIEEGDSR